MNVKTLLEKLICFMQRRGPTDRFRFFTVTPHHYTPSCRSEPPRITLTQIEKMHVLEGASGELLWTNEAIFDVFSAAHGNIVELENKISHLADQVSAQKTEIDSLMDIISEQTDIIEDLQDDEEEERDTLTDGIASQLKKHIEDSVQIDVLNETANSPLTTKELGNMYVWCIDKYLALIDDPTSDSDLARRYHQLINRLEKKIANSITVSYGQN